MCEGFLWYFPKNNFDHCISHTEMRSHMADFGITEFRRTVANGIPVYEIQQPLEMAGFRRLPQQQVQ